MTPRRTFVIAKSSLAAGAVACLLLLAGCGGSGAPGDEIAFVSSRDGVYAIYGMNADGSDQARLTDEGGDSSTLKGVQFQTDPAWSPDGTKIAFASAREGSFDIYAMNADGTGTTRLTSSNANDQGPTWSSDGSRIAFARSTSDGSHVWLMNADGTDVHRLTDDDLTAESEPAWSPDGSWIAYTYRVSGSDFREIWVAHPDGSGRRSVTKLQAKSYAPAWAPDSRRLAFSANRDGVRYDIYTIGLDGMELRRPVRSSEDAFEPAWSPDGSEIAFSRDGAIVTVDIQGAEAVLTDPANNDSSPAWRPAGTSGEESN